MIVRVCVFVLALSVQTSDSLFIDGCAMYGCRPSGSFSFYLDAGKTNMSLSWVKNLDPVPHAMGCSANSFSVICQSNGIFSDDMGYVSLYSSNGTVRWKDHYLHYPTLALLDNYGDVTGSDGVSLVHYDMDGKTYPVIPLQSMGPIFSMQLVGTTYLLMVSEKGCLSLRDLNAIPDASIFLNATVQRVNGTFLPVSPPVVNGQRFYLLTEFVPDMDQYEPSVLNLQRLYAIDVHNRMADIMTIAWYYNFERLEGPPKVKANADDSTIYVSSQQTEGEQEQAKRSHVGNDGDDKFVHEYTVKAKHQQEIQDDFIAGKQILLWNNATQTVYVILPPPYASPDNVYTSFWGLKDTADDVSLAFHISLPVSHMATFEPDTDISGNVNADDHSEISVVNNEVWAATDDAKIYSIRKDGNISRTIDLNAMLGVTVTITSKLSVSRKDNNATDILVLGISVVNTTGEFRSLLISYGLDFGAKSFVIGVDTSVLKGKLAWIVSIPDNMQVKGQVVGSAGTALQLKDQLIFYADDNDKVAQVISIH